MKKAALTILILATFNYLYSANFKDMSKLQKRIGITAIGLSSVYSNMIQRCHNSKNPEYYNYGARGITVCEEWRNSSKIFLEWALNNGWSMGLELDRRNNNKGYSPDNCRWVTRLINSNNKRNTIMVVYNGQERPLRDWCRMLNLNYQRTYHRLFVQKIDVFSAFNKGLWVHN